MAPWLIAIIFVATFLGIGALADLRARKIRHGLERDSTSTPASDQVDTENRHRAQDAQDITIRYGPLP